MGKQSGLGDRLYVGGYDLSGDIGSLDTISSPRGTLDTTGIDKYANERIYGTKDGDMQFTSFFNVDTAQAHPVLSAMPTTDIGVVYGHGTTLGNIAAAMIGKQINYDPTRGSDGSFTFKTEVQANGYGLEWGKQATAGIRTDTTGTNGSSIDLGSVGSLSFGLQAYLHVFALTGTNVVVKLQGSSDDGAGDAFADITGGAFTSVTAARVTQRLQTSSTQTIERYLRVVTSGTFTSASFIVVVVRNPVAVTF